MKRDIVSDVLGYIDDSYISEAANYSASQNNLDEKTIKRKRLFKVVLVAAMLMSLFAVTAVGVEMYVNSPQMAVEIAKKELAKMQDIGILSGDIVIENEPKIVEFEERKTKEGRIYNHLYSVRSLNGKYSVTFDVDTKDGIVRSFNIEAFGDESDERSDDREMELNGKVYYYYNNFDDIFDPTMTVDKFCIRLAKYWGFTGYTLSSTEDEFYGYDTEAPDGSALLSSICEGPYITVYFEGDQRNMPMYIELGRFPGRMFLVVGKGHLNG